MGLTLKKKCKLRCDVKGIPCAHPKVPESYYVEFRVSDDGEVLRLATSAGRLKLWKVGSLNKTVAKQQEALIRSRLLSGQEVSPSKRKAQSVTFQQWATVYLNLDTVKSLKGYAIRKLYVANLCSFFAGRHLSSITPEDVQKYRAQRVNRLNGKPVSIQTINHDHMTLTHMLNVARSPQFKLLVDNPAEHVPKPNPRNERDRIVSPEEWEQIRLTASPHLRRLLTIAYYLGPRKGELLNLEWSDVDLRRKEFRLRETKNDEPRVVPMTPIVVEVFHELQRERRKGEPRVFLYKGKPMSRISTAFSSACRRAGITDLHVHDFRHTASTNFRRAGIDTTTAMKIVGHKSEKMHRRYNTITPDDLHRAIARLETSAAPTLIRPKDSDEGTKIVSR